MSYVSIPPPTPIMIGAQNFYASPLPPVHLIGITPMGLTIQGYVFNGLFSMAAVWAWATGFFSGDGFIIPATLTLRQRSGPALTRSTPRL